MFSNSSTVPIPALGNNIYITFSERSRATEPVCIRSKARSTLFKKIPQCGWLPLIGFENQSIRLEARIRQWQFDP